MVLTPEAWELQVEDEGASSPPAGGPGATGRPRILSTEGPCQWDAHPATGTFASSLRPPSATLGSRISFKLLVELLWSFGNSS